MEMEQGNGVPVFVYRKRNHWENFDIGMQTYNMQFRGFSVCEQHCGILSYVIRVTLSVFLIAKVDKSLNIGPN